MPEITTDDELQNAFESIQRDIARSTRRRSVWVSSNGNGEIIDLAGQPDQPSEITKEETKIIDPETIIKLYKPFCKSDNEIIKEAKYKDCVVTIRGLYFHKDDKNIVKDCITDKYTWIHDATSIINVFDSNGLPDYKNSNAYVDRNNHNKLIKCYYSLSGRGNDIDEFYTLYKFINTEYYYESLKSGLFIHENCKKLINSENYARYRKVNAIKKAKNLSLNEMYKFGLKSPSFLRTEGKKYTFGVELETICGVIPSYLDDELNYEAVHDGSLRDENGNVNGGEYVTGILTGDTGFLQLHKLTYELKRRTKVDFKCGMHVHLGLENCASFNKELIVTLYKLCLMVESQIFELLPISRRNNEYCRNIASMNLMYYDSDFESKYNFDIKTNEYYDDIVNFVSSGFSSSDKVNKKKDHPMGHKCGYNHRSARYCWLNLVPTLFDTRKNGIYTVEFRNHPGTTSYLKTKNWLLICMALLWYAENYQKEILKAKDISLKGIIMLAYPKQGHKLVSYMEKRIDKFSIKDTVAAKEVEKLDYDEEVDTKSSVNKMSIKDI